jgi:hypothetical protein
MLNFSPSPWKRERLLNRSKLVCWMVAKIVARSREL